MTGFEYQQQLHREADLVAGLENAGNVSAARDRLALDAQSMGASTSGPGRQAYNQLLQDISSRETGSVKVKEYHNNDGDEVYVMLNRPNGDPGGAELVTNLSQNKVAPDSNYWQQVDRHRETLTQQAQYIAGLENNGDAAGAAAILQRDATSMNAAADPAPYRWMLRQVQNMETGSVHVNLGAPHGGWSDVSVVDTGNNYTSIDVGQLPVGRHIGYNYRHVGYNYNRPINLLPQRSITESGLY